VPKNEKSHRQHRNRYTISLDMYRMAQLAPNIYVPVYNIRVYIYYN